MKNKNKLKIIQIVIVKIRYINSKRFILILMILKSNAQLKIVISYIINFV
jgi:hypothetical protein